MVKAWFVFVRRTVRAVWWLGWQGPFIVRKGIGIKVLLIRWATRFKILVFFRGIDSNWIDAMHRPPVFPPVGAKMTVIETIGGLVTSVASSTFVPSTGMLQASTVVPSTGMCQTSSTVVHDGCVTYLTFWSLWLEMSLCRIGK